MSDLPMENVGITRHQEDGESFHYKSLNEIRDFFAVNAMLGQIGHEGMEGMDAKLVSEMAYELADALMIARKRK